MKLPCFDDVSLWTKESGTAQGRSRDVGQLKHYGAVGLPEELYYQSPFDLSGGQKRRVAIAGVLAMRPEVLILDEPTAGLDPKGRDEISRSACSNCTKRRGITVILVSHSMEDVAKYVGQNYCDESGTGDV